MDSKFWYDQVPSEPVPEKKAKEEVVLDKRQKAKSLFDNETLKHTRTSKDASSSWLTTIMSSGTSSDRTAAMTLEFQKSYFRFNILDSLTTMAKKKIRRESQMAIESLKELFIHCLLPPNRTLRYFKDQPLLKSDLTDKELLYWYFEEEVKVRYNVFLKILETGLQDNLTHYKNFILGTTNDLLKNRELEQQSILLSLIVNKLGDPEKKTSSKACFLMSQLAESNPGLRLNLIREIELYVSRKNLGPSAEYYALLFLNSIKYLKAEIELANRVTLLYFSILKILEAKNDYTGKLIRSIITGITRAFPYFSLPYEVFEENIELFYNVIVSTSFNKSTETQMLLFKVFSSNSTELPERFYRSLYAKLYNPDLYRSSKLGMFLHVLFQALEIDTSINRVMAFIKRLLQASFNHKPGFCCAALLLVAELFKIMPSLHYSFTSRPEITLHIGKNLKKNKGKKDDLKKENDKENEGKADENTEKPTSYDPKFKRPEESRAELTCLWELIDLTRHYHPTVVKFANSLLEGTPIVYDSNPLVELSFHTFLNRFSFKNPKKKLAPNKVKKTAKALQEAPVSSDVFLKKTLEEIPDSEQFFHKYFQQRSKGIGALNKKRREKPEKKSEPDEDDIAFKGEDEALQLSDDEGSDLEGEVSDDEGREKEEDDDDDDSEEGEFSYDDLTEEDFIEDKKDTSRRSSDPTEKELEKMLLDNLSSSDEEEDPQVPIKKKTHGDDDNDLPFNPVNNKFFASADDFAEILDKSLIEKPDDEQLAWEESLYKKHQKKPRRPKSRKSENQKQPNSRSNKPPHPPRNQFKKPKKK